MSYESDTTTEAERFEEYLGQLSLAISFSPRLEHLVAYLTGLLLPGDRKSVEPMAAMVNPANTRAQHQAMHHFVAKSDWSGNSLLAQAYEYAIGPMTSHGPIKHWVFDDTGLPKSGIHSVGVARQYCGANGKRDLCQVAVSLSICNEFASLPIGYRLYLPKEWAADPDLRQKTGVPDDVVFQEKWKIALDLVDEALASGKPPADVLADAGYGVATEFRDALTERHLTYLVGVQSTMTVWPPGTSPLPPKPHSGRGRPSTNVRRDADNQPMTTLALAISLPPGSFQQVAWREGARGTMQSRFAVIRVRPAHRDYNRQEPRPEEWLLIEWPEKEKEPTKFWLSTHDPGVTISELVRHAKERWHVERDYQELKDELGLDHYEGRNWRGFHHHASLCIAAYAFLVAERSRFSPLSLRRRTLVGQIPPVPTGFHRRGSPEDRAASAHVHHHDTPPHSASSQPPVAKVSDLPLPAGGAEHAAQRAS